MSKTSYLLIVLLVICLGIFVSIKYFSPVTPKLATLTDKQTISSTLSQGTLSLKPSRKTVAAGQTATIDIFLETQNVTPTVLQFEIAYDPTTVIPSQIVHGAYFTAPIVLLNDINPRNGRISYALKCSADCGNKATERIAQIIFTINPLAQNKETSFIIMPKTLLETKEATEVVLKTSNAKIFIQGEQTPQATPSAM